MVATNVRQIACYLTPDQHEALKALSARTRIRMQEFLREAVDDVLKKHNATPVAATKKAKKR